MKTPCIIISQLYFYSFSYGYFALSNSDYFKKKKENYTNDQTQ